MADHLHELQIDVIINTTPLGMIPDIDATPLPDYQFTQGQVVFDMVYNPIDTALLRRAKTEAAICISGLDMFIGQGLKQIELWLNKPVTTAAIIDEISTVLKHSLNKTGRQA